MGADEADYHLLGKDDEVSSSPTEFARTRREHLTKGQISWFMVLTLLACSALSNIYMYRQLWEQQGTSHLSRYAGLRNDIESEYHMYTDYMSLNTTLSDPLWDDLPVSPIVIALDNDYVEEHGLEKSIPFPWNPAKGLYHLKAFHHMHCLKNIRRAFLDALDPSSNPLPENYTIPPSHILHCLDTLRQDLACHADDLPMPTIPERHHIGDGQKRQCRDLNALLEWSQHPDRHACFQMLSEYREVPHSLEQFQFCLNGSKEEKVMREYFETYGHRDPYHEDESDKIEKWDEQ